MRKQIRKPLQWLVRRQHVVGPGDDAQIGPWRTSTFPAPAANSLAGDEPSPVVQGGRPGVPHRRSLIIVRVCRRHRRLCALVELWQRPHHCGIPKDGGRVQLRGLIKDGAGGSIAFTPAAGFRPTATQIFSAVCDTAASTRIDIKATGEAQVTLPTGSVGFLSLDGISFLSD